MTENGPTLRVVASAAENARSGWSSATADHVAEIERHATALLVRLGRAKAPAPALAHLVAQIIDTCAVVRDHLPEDA